MKTKTKILVAFILNLAFSIFEFVGGAITMSVAITSDAVHDLGDAMSIGVSYFMERKSRKQPDEKYTYGYARYSVLGGVIITCILLLGSAAVVYSAVLRMINPVEINYNGMIIFAVIGVAVNFIAAYITRGGHSINQRAVNLHMLEDVLGWTVVLVGAVVMKFTNITVIDSIMTMGVAGFILFNAIKNLQEVLELFLEKTPHGINIDEIENCISEIDGVSGVHHIHVWSLDGQNTYATMHIVSNGDSHDMKERVREKLKERGINHATLELEAVGEHCHEKECHIEFEESEHRHHHHHHNTASE